MSSQDAIVSAAPGLRPEVPPRVLIPSPVDIADARFGARPIGLLYNASNQCIALENQARIRHNDRPDCIMSKEYANGLKRPVGRHCRQIERHASRGNFVSAVQEVYVNAPHSAPKC